MRRTTRVTAAATLALLVSAALLSSCSCSDDAGKKLDPELAKKLKLLHVWCPHCQKAYTVEKKQAEAVEGSDPIFLRALKIPCPNCKKTGGQEAIQCAHCDAYVPVAVARGKAGVTKCPGCGKYPYGAGGPPDRDSNTPPVRR